MVKHPRRLSLNSVGSQVSRSSILRDSQDFSEFSAVSDSILERCSSPDSGSDASLVRLSTRISGRNKVEFQILCEEIRTLKLRNKELEEAARLAATKNKYESLPPRRLNTDQRRHSIEMELEDLIVEINKKDRLIEELHVEKRQPLEDSPMQELKVECEELQMECCQLQDEVQKLQADKNGLKSQLRLKEDKIKDMAANQNLMKNLEIRTVCSSLEQDMVLLLQEETDRREIAEVNSRAICAEVERLKVHVAEMRRQEEVEQLKAQVEEMRRQEELHLHGEERCVGSSALVVHDLADELRISEELSAYAEKVQSLETALTQKETAISAFMVDKDVLSKENLNWRVSMQTAHEEIQSKIASLGEAERRSEVLENQNIAWSVAMQRANEEIQSNMASLGEAKQRSEALEKENMALAERIEQEKLGAQSNLASLRDVEQRSETLEKENLVLVERLEMEKAQVLDKTSLAEEIQRHLTAVKIEKVELREDATRLKDELQAKVLLLEQAEHMLLTVKEKNTKLNEMLRNERSGMQVLNHTLLEMNEYLEEVKGDHAELAQTLENERCAGKKILLDAHCVWQQEKADLASQLALERKSSAKRFQHVTLLKHAYSRVQEENEKVFDLLAEKNAVVCQMSTENSALSDLLEQERKEDSDYRDYENATLLHTIERERVTGEDLRAGLRRLTNQKQELQRAYSIIEKQHRRLTRSNAKVNMMLSGQCDDIDRGLCDDTDEMTTSRSNAACVSDLIASLDRRTEELVEAQEELWRNRCERDSCQMNFRCPNINAIVAGSDRSSMLGPAKLERIRRDAKVGSHTTEDDSYRQHLSSESSSMRSNSEGRRDMDHLDAIQDHSNDSSVVSSLYAAFSSIWLGSRADADCRLDSSRIL